MRMACKLVEGERLSEGVIKRVLWKPGMMLAIIAIEGGHVHTWPYDHLVAVSDV